MPYSEKQRRFFFAQAKRKKNHEGGLRTTMSLAKLEQEAHAPLKKKKKQ